MTRKALRPILILYNEHLNVFYCNQMGDTLRNINALQDYQLMTKKYVYIEYTGFKQSHTAAKLNQYEMPSLT